MSYKILVINPGSTSTKIGVYEDETLLFEETLRHSTEEIAKYATIVDQKDFRSINRIGLDCEKKRLLLARSITSRTSFTPEVTALNV